MSEYLGSLYTALTLIITGCQNPSDSLDTGASNALPTLQSTKIIEGDVYDYFWNNNFSFTKVSSIPETYPNYEYRVFKDKVSGDIIVETAMNPEGDYMILYHAHAARPRTSRSPDRQHEQGQGRRLLRHVQKRIILLAYHQRLERRRVRDRSGVRQAITAPARPPKEPCIFWCRRRWIPSIRI